jgi:predicted alpha/beta hydrolase family esterase
MMLSAGIGQKNCPVVFVCHSLGGLVAKQIVIHAWNQPDPDEETRALLRNIKGFFFYATPHLGSKLVEYADNVLVRHFFDKGLVLEYLRVLDKNTAVLNHAFEQAHRQHFKDWKLYVIGETHDTKIVSIYTMSSLLMFNN